MNIHIERNISSHSSFEFPFCLVDDSGYVVGRCESLAIAEARKGQITEYFDAAKDGE